MIILIEKMYKTNIIPH